MAAGIAVEFKKLYPEMYEAYRARCKAEPRQFNPGDSFLWKAQGQPSVFNLGTQERPGGHATYQAVETAMGNMRQQAEAEHIGSIAMPRIGAGYGRLSWAKVRIVIERVLGDWHGALYVYEEYIPDT